MKIRITKIAVWLILFIDVVMWFYFMPAFLKDYSEFQSLVWNMDSTQNRLIKELVDANNKTVDNQNQLIEYLKSKKEDQP